MKTSHRSAYLHWLICFLGYVLLVVIALNVHVPAKSLVAVFVTFFALGLSSTMCWVTFEYCHERYFRIFYYLSVALALFSTHAFLQTMMVAFK